MTYGIVVFRTVVMLTGVGGRLGGAGLEQAPAMSTLPVTSSRLNLKLMD
jgi:hypothetical protein